MIGKKYKMPYYQKLAEFRETDIRYIGSGGYETAKKEFGKDVDKKLKENIWNIPDKERIYLEYVDDKNKRQKLSSAMNKERQKELINKYPDLYRQYKDAILRIKYKYTQKNLPIKAIPKKWPEYIVNQYKEREIEKEIKKRMEEKQV